MLLNLVQASGTEGVCTNHGIRIQTTEILKPCAEWKLRGKLWKAWRERENRIGVKIEGALEICGISALAPPRVHGIYLSHTNYRPTHGTIPARSMFEP